MGDRILSRRPSPGGFLGVHVYVHAYLALVGYLRPASPNDVRRRASELEASEQTIESIVQVPRCLTRAEKMCPISPTKPFPKNPITPRHAPPPHTSAQRMNKISPPYLHRCSHTPRQPIYRLLTIRYFVYKSPCLCSERSVIAVNRLPLPGSHQHISSTRILG